jgi:hypothetical protein
MRQSAEAVVRPLIEFARQLDPAKVARFQQLDERWVMRPALDGLCKYESLIDGTLDLADIVRMNDALDMQAERQEVARQREIDDIAQGIARGIKQGFEAIARIERPASAAKEPAPTQEQRRVYATRLIEAFEQPVPKRPTGIEDEYWGRQRGWARDAVRKLRREIKTLDTARAVLEVARPAPKAPRQL